MRTSELAAACNPVAAAMPAVELLEGRRMLAAQPVGTAAVDASGALVVTGTRTSDTIEIELSTTPGQLDVTINGATSTFNLADIVAGVRVSGGNGHDQILVDAAVSLEMELFGGNGHDVLVGGAGNDLIVGGNGKDRCLGGAGNDLLYGGNGKDEMEGEVGDDEMHGQNGVDALTGGLGDDCFAWKDQHQVLDRAGTEGLIIRLAQIPATVLAAFNAAYPGATIVGAEVEFEIDSEEFEYEYELEAVLADGTEFEVEFSAEGTLAVT